jgi:hypothetical protein
MFDVCASNSYFQQYSASQLKHHTIVMSHWGSDYNTMSWLDHMTGCGGDCDGQGKVTYSNFRIHDLCKSEQMTQ